MKRIETTQITLYNRHNAATLRFNETSKVYVEKGWIEFEYVSASQGTKHYAEFPLADYDYSYKLEED